MNNNIDNIEKIDCCICLSKIKKNNFCVLKCHHSFCANCLLAWSDLKNACPLCNSKIYTLYEGNKLETHTKFINYKYKCIFIINASLDYLKPSLSTKISKWIYNMSNKTMKHITKIINDFIFNINNFNINNVSNMVFVKIYICIFFALIGLNICCQSIDKIFANTYNKTTIFFIKIFTSLSALVWGIIFGYNIAKYKSKPNSNSNSNSRIIYVDINGEVHNFR
jgi:hypothetical protein